MTWQEIEKFFDNNFTLLYEYNEHQKIRMLDINKVSPVKIKDFIKQIILNVLNEAAGEINKETYGHENGEKILRNMTKKKIKCRWCGKSKGIIKFYIMADDLKHPKPYHPACIRKFKIEVIKKLSDIYSQINN
jgi:hypothetical protein